MYYALTLIIASCIFITSLSLLIPNGMWLFVATLVASTAILSSVMTRIASQE